MNDKELLEFAALSIGGIYDSGFISTDGGIDFDQWEPLDDDGDALRLAVKLQLTICNEHVSAGAVYCTNGDEDYPMVLSGKDESDVIDSDFSATRRAIIIAAAEIGRAIK